MLIVIVGKSNQNHENDGQNGEEGHAQDGHGQQGLVELGVQHVMQVLLGGLELLAIGQVLLGELVLLHVQAPGVEERQDEEDGQYAVEHDEEGVVAVDNGALSGGAGGLGAQRRQLRHIADAEEPEIEVEYQC